MNHSMWKKWRDFRFEALTEGDKDPTIEGLIAGMTGAAMNLIPTLTNMTKYIDFIMKPDDPKKSPEENDLNKQTVILHLGKKFTIKRFNYKRNQIFLKEIKYFLNCIKNNKLIDGCYNIENGIKSLELAVNLKKKSIKN